MSKIEDLIQELCPDGVEYKKLQELCLKVESIRWADYPEEERCYIDLSSVDRNTHKIGKLVSVNKRNAPSRAKQIVYGGDLLFATTRPTQMRCCVVPLSLDGQLCSTGYCVLRLKTQVNNHFVFHLLTTSDFQFYLEANQTEGNYPSISDKLLRQYKIPVPPIEVQEEIVRVLDSFAELEAELEARRRQYAYYRDQLLTFDKSEIERERERESF